MPITYSVNEKNTESILARSMREHAELELSSDVKAYKAAARIIKEYKDSARNIIVPTLNIRKSKVIAKSIDGLPDGFVQMPRTPNSNKRQNASNGLNFMYMGMTGTVTSVAPKKDYSFKMLANPYSVTPAPFES
tara:strand:- start:871 stop:1272 length:402 start_codon:yes stop_codon:yes gene_type:complete